MMLFIDASLERPGADLNRVLELPDAVKSKHPLFVKNTSLEHDLLVLPKDGQRGDPDRAWPFKLIPLQAQSFGSDGERWWIV